LLVLLLLVLLVRLMCFDRESNMSTVADVAAAVTTEFFFFVVVVVVVLYKRELERTASHDTKNEMLVFGSFLSNRVVSDKQRQVVKIKWVHHK
jgi:hypothetical protein